MEYMQAHLLITGIPGLAAWPNYGLFKVATSSYALFLWHCLSVSSVLLIFIYYSQVVCRVLMTNHLLGL